jgi:hypothetical protein
MTTAIKTGDYVEVPKGTTVYELAWRHAYYDPKDNNPKASKTARVVQVDVVPLVLWVNDQDPTDMYPYDAARMTGNEGKTFTETQMGDIVKWSNTKWTHIANVKKVDPPEVKDTPAKAPTLRQQMVPKTIWKVTDAVPIYNTEKRNVVHPRGHTYTETYLVNHRNLDVDTQFTVTDKSSNNFPGIWGYNGELGSSGIWIPVEIVASSTASDVGKSTYLQLKDINGKIEQVGAAPVVPIFVIWDTATKSYYSGYDYQYGGNGTLKYKDKLAAAKKFNRLADVRAHALVQSGYYDGLPESWGSIPDWMGQEKSFDVPDTWEIVKIDKLTKNEIERIELIDTFKRSWKLRALTVKYGSAVRAIYSDLEKKNKLSEFSAVMVFGKKEDEKYYWNNELSDEERAEVKSSLSEIDAVDMKFGKGLFTQAVGLRDIGTAVVARLSYTGKLECQVLDLENLIEVVVNQPAQ